LGILAATLHGQAAHLILERAAVKLGPCEEGKVTDDELRQLLYRRESETLDFTRDQYVFAKASEAQKAELLKDILAFANAWRPCIHRARRTP
jgi:hypothetical protein